MPAASPTSAATAGSCAGLWARITTSARWASSRLEASASPPTSSASPAARPEPASVNSAGSPQPRASARAMLPEPMKPTCIGPTSLRLVEEALLDEARPLLGRHLDVARGEQVDLVGHLLDAAVERVRQPAGEVDHPLGQHGLRGLQVDDHGDRVLELVPHFLGFVKRLRAHQVHAPLRAASVGAAPADRAQHAGAALGGAGLLGEDVIDLVAAAARGQPPDVRALAVAGRELLLGRRDRGGGLVLVV